MRQSASTSVTALAVLAIFAGCNATNTGNPATADAPAGIELVRSNLERDADPRVPPATAATFSQDNRDFAFDLYRVVRATEGNVFYSPYSTSVALAMTYAGAKGETKTEMADALHFTLDEPALHEAFNATDVALRARADDIAGGGDAAGTGFQLELVNAAFGRNGEMFVDDYLDVLAVHYGTGMFRADFQTHADRERIAINRWVQEKTHDRIRNLLPANSLTDLTVFVLVNAIYFKASWLTPFDVERTEAATFRGPAGDVSVHMMRAEIEPYFRGDGYAAAELAYISPDVRMLFILPDEGRFDEVESKLDRALFDQARAGLDKHTVNFGLPRFSFEFEAKLKDTLKSLGMLAAFEAGRADLSGIAGAPNRYFIDQVYHKAFVAVDEQGTEAAASTAVVGVDESSGGGPVDFVLDRPFMFAVYDEPTGQILFVGRLVDPS